jgi:hypothetical protein
LSIALKALGERSLAVVAKGWMADVVRQTRGLHYVCINTETTSELTPNLGNFQGVRQAVPREI